MASLFKQVLKYLAVYVCFWFVMTQVNGFATMLSLYFPVFWVFVYFPAVYHKTQTGFMITVMSGVFFESQFAAFRGGLLPLMVVIFLILRYRRSIVVDTKHNTRIWIATLVHFAMTLFPSLYLWQFDAVNSYQP